jgi:hypothetical protein
MSEADDPFSIRQNTVTLPYGFIKQLLVDIRHNLFFMNYNMARQWSLTIITAIEVWFAKHACY